MPTYMHRSQCISPSLRRSAYDPGKAFCLLFAVMTEIMLVAAAVPQTVIDVLLVRVCCKQKLEESRVLGTRHAIRLGTHSRTH